MANLTKIGWFGDNCSFSFIYNDSTMKLTGISAINNSTKTLRIFLLSPFVAERNILPGDTLSYSIPAAQRPTYQLVSREIHNGYFVNVIEGINWRAEFVI